MYLLKVEEIINQIEQEQSNVFEFQNNLEKQNGNELITTGLICTLCGFLLQLSYRKTNPKLSNTIKKITYKKLYEQEKKDNFRWYNPTTWYWT